MVGARQTFWDQRAATNFAMGGMSTGLAIAAFVAHLVARSQGDWLFPTMGVSGLLTVQLLAGLGMALGLGIVFLEIGRKRRFLYVLLRPQTSWMTRETYAVAVFFPALLADLLWPHVALHGLIAVTAAVFLVCQARILYAGRGIPTWRVPLMPWMLTATGIFEGLGLLAVISAVLGGVPAVFNVVFIGIALFAAVNMSLWHAFRTTAKARGVGPLSRRDLNAITPQLHIDGHVLPMILAIVGAVLADAALVGIAGFCAIVGGGLWKFHGDHPRLSHPGIRYSEDAAAWFGHTCGPCTSFAD